MQQRIRLVPELDARLSERAKMASVILAMVVSGGCATYRVNSNLDRESVAVPPPALATAVLLSEDELPNRKFRELGPVEVSVKKLTIFNADPTREQANGALVEKARSMGADAVIRIKYTTGIGLTTWGYIDAKGTGVKLME